MRRALRDDQWDRIRDILPGREGHVAPKRMARPVRKRIYRDWRLISLLQRIRSREVSPRPKWRYARSSPHKRRGVERRFLGQASGAPFDC
jgi:hypothetical protein